MKKEYITPETLIAQINSKATILITSPGGVATGSGVGNDYNKDDVSYSRRRRRDNDWEDDWEDEEDY